MRTRPPQLASRLLPPVLASLGAVNRLEKPWARSRRSRRYVGLERDLVAGTGSAYGRVF